MTTVRQKAPSDSTVARAWDLYNSTSLLERPALLAKWFFKFPPLLSIIMKKQQDYRRKLFVLGGLLPPPDSCASPNLEMF